MVERLLRREEAAEYLRQNAGFGTTRWLAKLACVGGGPKFRKISKYPVYTTADLDAWIAEKVSRTYSSTADYASDNGAAA